MSVYSFFFGNKAATYKPVPKNIADNFTARLRSLMVKLESTCDCGGVKKVGVCEQTLKTLQYAMEKGKTNTVNETLKKIFQEQVQFDELAKKEKLTTDLIQEVQSFLKDLGKVVPLETLTPEVNKMLEAAMSSPKMSPPETTPIHSTQNQTAPDNTTIIAHDKTATPIQNTQDIATKDIPPTQKLPEAAPKDTTITTFLSEMVNLPEPEQIVILKAPEKPKDKAPEILDKKPEKTEHKKQNTPTLDTARREPPAPTQKSESKTPNLSTNDPKQTAPEHSTFKDSAAKPVQSSSTGHTEKTLTLEHKLRTIISDKAPDAAVVLKETLAQVRQNTPQEATVNMTTLANVIAHVGKADTSQLAPTLTHLKSIIHMPADSVATVGHSLALVAKQSPEALPIVREMLQSLPQTPATVTAASQTILACLEVIPTTVVNHTTQPAPNDTLPTLAKAIIAVAKAAPESLPQVLSVLSTVAEAAPKALPDMANTLSSMAKQAPKTLETVTQLIQTLSSTQPESLPKLANTLLSLSKTATPQQMQTAITVLNTVMKDAPKSLPALLETLTPNAAPTATHTSAMPAKAEIVSPLFRQVPTGQVRLESTAQSLTFQAQTHPAPTTIAELKTQTRQNATIELLNNTLKTAPETLPLLITIFKSSQSQPVVAAKLMTVLQDIQNNHPQDMPKVAKALSNFTQSTPQHVAKAVTLIATVLAQSPKTVAPLTTALQIISTGPFAVQKEALQHLDMAKNIQTLHHSASEMATLKTTRSTPKSETATFRTPQAHTSSPRAENTVVLQKTTVQQKPTAEQFRSMPHTQQIHATIASNIPTATRPPASIIQVQSTLVAQYPQLRGQVAPLFATINTIAPAALQQVATTLSDIAKIAPQHLEKAITLLAAVADKAPTALHHVAATISTVATQTPQHLAKTLALLSTIADKAPAALQPIATALNSLAKHAPELFKVGLDIAQKIADKAPDLLPKFSQFLLQFQDAGHQDQLHTQLLALMQALAAEASEDQVQLLQKLLALGDLKATQDPALHAYVLGEIKKTKKTDKEKHTKHHKKSTTDQLIMLFESLEKEDWKLAAMFRKMLEERV